MEDPIRLGVKFSPPTLIVEYKNLDHYRVSFESLRGEEAAEVATRKLFSEHREYFAKIQESQVKKLIEMLIDDDEDDESLDPLSAKLVDGTVDLNRCSEFQLTRAKAVMSRGYEKRLVKPTDPDYVYDKQRDFQDPEGDSGWDDD